MNKWREFIPKSLECFKKYSFSLFRKDCLSGITVGIVAVPLALAFAIASGVGPERGLYTAIVAGFLISFLGGSKYQIGGPTGAFVVVVFDIVQRNGYQGLVIATALAALFLIIIGFCRLGVWIKYIPYPLTIGFTSGIAVIIFSSQIKDFLGLKMSSVPADFLSKWIAYGKALPTFDKATASLALGTLGLIIFLRKYFPKLPWGIVAIVLATAFSWFFEFPVETIKTRFGALPRGLPLPDFSLFHCSFDQIKALFPDAVTIALLAGIESLLCAVIADGMTGSRHKSNCELVAQGFANLGSIIFGGIPATGAIARTVTNVKMGAKTPVSGMIHAVTLLGIIAFMSPIVSFIPLASLSAILIVIAWNMSEMSRFRHLFKAPLGDIAILLTAFFLTIFVDITVAVEMGVILAAFLFMKRMSEHALPISAEEEKEKPFSKKQVPEGVEVYEIQGPLFFAVADSLQDILRNLQPTPKVFILRLHQVPDIDATGLHSLREFYQKCVQDETLLFLSGVKPSLRKQLSKFGVESLIGKDHLTLNLDDALEKAKKILKKKK